MKNTLIALLCAIFVFACSSQPRQPERLQLDIGVTEPDRIRFAGKGAGAGMMLMSSMGPMGIAIGVAIDEGIGKEIDESARVQEFDIRTILSEQIQQQWQSLEDPSKAKALNLTIKRYGFITQPGDNDPVAPQLHITVGEKEITFPESFDAANIPTAPLEKVKTDPVLVKALYEKAALVVSQSLFALSEINTVK